MWRRISSVHPVCRSYQLGLMIMFDKRTKGCYIMGTIFVNKQNHQWSVLSIYSLLHSTPVFSNMPLFLHWKKTWQSQQRFGNLVAYLWEILSTMCDSPTILLLSLCNRGKPQNWQNPLYLQNLFVVWRIATQCLRNFHNYPVNWLLVSKKSNLQYLTASVSAHIYNCFHPKKVTMNFPQK